VRSFTVDLQRRQRFDTHASVPTQPQLLSDHSIGSYLRVLRAFSSWLLMEGYTAHDVLARIKLPRTTEKIQDTFSEGEIITVFRSLNPRTEIGDRDYQDKRTRRGRHTGYDYALDRGQKALACAIRALVLYVPPPIKAEPVPPKKPRQLSRRLSAAQRQTYAGRPSWNHRHKRDWTGRELPTTEGPAWRYGAEGASAPLDGGVSGRSGGAPLHRGHRLRRTVGSLPRGHSVRLPYLARLARSTRRRARPAPQRA
jgi:hypothetical protein